MCEERVVVLRRGGGGTAEGGLGVSLGEQGGGGPHVIYRVEDDSPAARSGQVEAGDVILKVNGTDVNRYSTKEVLKCLRLSTDPVTLKIKRDPQIAASVRRFLATSHDRNSASSRHNHDRSCSSPPSSSSSSSCSRRSAAATGSSSEALLPRSPPQRAGRPPPKFETYMMTGDLILNLSRVEHQHNRYHRYNSTPVSPVEREHVARYHSSPADPTSHHNHTLGSNPASPEGCGEDARGRLAVRSSRSEDQLQPEADWGLRAALSQEATSSLHTLLDTSDCPSHPDRDRVVWTYNAPVSSASDSNSVSDSTSHRSSSPASPTSVSSSVMSSRATPTPHHRPPPARSASTSHNHRNHNGDMSLSEAISNMSSPDYQDQSDMLDAGRECPRMELSDPSDSDSTILVSEPCHKRAKCAHPHSDSDHTLNGDHYRIVIQVKGDEKQNGDLTPTEKLNGNLTSGNHPSRNQTSANQTGDRPHLTPDKTHTNNNQEQDAGGECNEIGSDEGSDAESLHSFHYSPKAVDLPSAVRLANRLYHLDGFKKSDVSRHLSKNNEFSRAVAEEYVKNFELSSLTLDAALRLFLSRFALSGETQERERVLLHFSRRYLECNPGTFNSQDAVHTLTCAIMLLNTDLHGGGAGGNFRRMTCSEFVDNLAELNDGENFHRDTLEQLYKAIRTKPLQWALDCETNGTCEKIEGPTAPVAVGSNPFLDLPDTTRATEYKKGYVMRKCCYDANAKKTAFGKRSWKMYYCTLRDMVLYLHKDEHGFTRTHMSDTLHNAIRIHHALATRASDYTKKQHVFRLQTADRAEYLFQTSDSKELSSWIDTINYVCALFSAQPLPGAVGSQRKFQRPLLPCSHTKLNLRDQLASHEDKVTSLEEELATLRTLRDKSPHARDKEQYLVYEVKRYRTYVSALQSRGGGVAAGAVAGAGEEAGAERAAPPP